VSQQELSIQEFSISDCQTRLSALSRAAKCGFARWQNFAKSVKDVPFLLLFEIDLPAPVANHFHEHGRPDATIASWRDAPRSYDAMSNAATRWTADMMTLRRQRLCFHVFDPLRDFTVEDSTSKTGHTPRCCQMSVPTTC